jgi:pantetheine-phosphate adenylyltransferase
MDVVEITDPFGPTAHDPDIQALVVSHETIAGGEAINKLRREKNLPELRIFVIDVIASTLHTGDDDTGDAEVSARIEEVVGDKDDGMERKGKVRVKVGDEVKTLDLSGERDEKRLKELKMGSTAIRQWIAERNEAKRHDTT